MGRPGSIGLLSDFLVVLVLENLSLTILSFRLSSMLFPDDLLPIVLMLSYKSVPENIVTLDMLELTLRKETSWKTNWSSFTVILFLLVVGAATDSLQRLQLPIWQSLISFHFMSKQSTV